jgi:hypothetical protein
MGEIRNGFAKLFVTGGLVGSFLFGVAMCERAIDDVSHVVEHGYKRETNPQESYSNNEALLFSSLGLLAVGGALYKPKHW